MTARRALVVDDSRSARAFLTRVLERYELAVDGVESAEQAIEYLTHQRPDVIFMDHLMPGMDGFQAVQAIKNNPRTATIPIMMYTSQEGELYLSQARALGAIGVLPKQIRHADVSKALDQLRLLGESRADDGAATIEAAALTNPVLPNPLSPNDSAPPLDVTRERRGPMRPELPALAPEQRAIIEAMMAHHMLELRRFMIDNLESQADRIIGDVRLLIHDREPLLPPARPRPRPMAAGAWLAVAGLLAAFLFGLQWAKQRSDSAVLATQLANTQQQLADTDSSLQALRAADAAAAASAAAPGNEASPAAGADDEQTTSLIEPVPFGETPLAGARLERVAALLSRLNAEGFHGEVDVRSIPGRFCMVSGPGGMSVLASDATLYSRCEQIGNPRDDNGSASQRQSVAFANMIATARQNSTGKLDIQVNAGNSDEAVTPYPPVSDSLTAGEWNRVAAANNRVEVHWQATH
jgi:CheY-like chemotaxis protein